MKEHLRTVFSTRQYMLSKDFEIYYYNDKGLGNMTSHTHNYYECYFFLEGSVNMHIKEAVHPLSHGNLVVIPPETPHYVEILSPQTPYRRFVFWISREYCEALGVLSKDYMYLIKKAEEGRSVWKFDEFSFNAVQTKVFQLIDEIHADRFGKEAKVSLCVNDLLLHLNRMVYEELHPKHTDVHSENLYDSIVSYIENHIDEELTLDLLAKKFYVSKYHISHVFTENMGYSLHQYIVKRRLSMCRDAIINGTSVGDACTAYGFTDYSVFYRAFLREYGKSPTKYRNELLRNAEWSEGTY